MDGEKMVAIISEAASTVTSLHSDMRENNKKQRVHITLCVRPNCRIDVTKSRVIFLTLDLAGERHFVSSVAKRLESLRALTHGDRRDPRSFAIQYR